jgi:hypothetical protein
VVAYTIDGGATYTKLTATATDTTNCYSFEVPENAVTSADTSISIVVSIKGDIDGNGRLTSGDTTELRLLVLKRSTLTGLQKLLADVDGNGRVTSGDTTELRTIILNKNNATW